MRYLSYLDSLMLPTSSPSFFLGSDVVVGRIEPVEQSSLPVKESEKALCVV